MIQLKATNLTDSYTDKIAVKFGKYVDSLVRKSKIVSNCYCTFVIFSYISFIINQNVIQYD